MEEAILPDSRLKGDLTQAPVGRTILRFTLPLLVANLLQQLYNIVDSIIVGQFVGKEALAAVSASYFIYFFVVSLSIGIGSGTTVVISQLFGARQYDKIRQTYSSLFFFQTGVGLLLSVAGFLFAEPLFVLIKTPADVLPDAVAYFRIFISGTFIFVAFNSIASALRGIGDSTRPMIFALISTVLNVGLDLLFVAALGWGVKGAAWATILAQGIGILSMIFYLRYKQPILVFWRKPFSFGSTLFVRALKIGFPTSVQQCAISLGLVTLLGLVNLFGTDTLTAYGAAGKIDSLITQASLTLASALAAFCGQHVGAEDMQRLRKGVRFSMGLNVVFSLTIYGLILLWGDQIMRLFSPDESVIHIGKEYLLIVGAFFLFNGALNILNGALRGAGSTLFAMLVSIISLWIIRLPLAYYMGTHYGRTGIWWAIGISICLALIVTVIYYYWGGWRKRCLPSALAE